MRTLQGLSLDNLFILKMENQTKFTNNQLLIGSLIVIILILGVYIFVEVPKLDTEQIRNDSFNAGTQQGILFWNSMVIQTVNEQQEIPYIVNNTAQYLPISQLCSGVQNAE